MNLFQVPAGANNGHSHISLSLTSANDLAPGKLKQSLSLSLDDQSLQNITLDLCNLPQKLLSLNLLPGPPASPKCAVQFTHFHESAQPKPESGYAFLVSTLLTR